MNQPVTGLFPIPMNQPVTGLCPIPSRAPQLRQEDRAQGYSIKQAALAGIISIGTLVQSRLKKPEHPHIITEQNSLESDFHTACQKGSLDEVKKVLQSGLENLNTVATHGTGSENKETGFMYVCSQSASIKSKDQTGSDPYKKFYEIAEYLLMKYKNRLDLTIVNRKKLQVVDKLLVHNHPMPSTQKLELIKLIVKKTNLDSKGKNYDVDDRNEMDNTTILWRCCKRSDIAPKVVKIIVQAGANGSDQYDNPVPGGSILHQIIFWYLKYKKHEHRRLELKLTCILKNISFEAFNLSSETEGTVLSYAEKHRNDCLDLYYTLKDKAEEFSSSQPQLNEASGSDSQEPADPQRKRARDPDASDCSHDRSIAFRPPKSRKLFSDLLYPCSDKVEEFPQPQSELKKASGPDSQEQACSPFSQSKETRCEENLRDASPIKTHSGHSVLSVHLGKLDPSYQLLENIFQT